MSDTPETDQFKVKFQTVCCEKYWVPVEFSEKLEKERNELARRVNELQSEVYYYQMQPYKIECEKNKLIQELDFYKKKKEELTSLLQFYKKAI